jgi:hypothetical protein
LVLVSTFSHKLRPEQSPAERLAACNTALYYMPYMSVDGLARGYDAYNRVIREAARDTGALLVDGEDRIPGDDLHFKDSVHLSARGCTLQAHRVSEALLAAHAFHALLEDAP